jgi:hypothetical protein
MLVTLVDVDVTSCVCLPLNVWLPGERQALRQSDAGVLVPGSKQEVSDKVTSALLSHHGCILGVM